ncbi:MerR family transcriptional regulator [Glutamicibacter endophyticus]|uniref:MerR family transcriptional regulator n=1 Tax=Glutamicibacter endophyticus TaxID=1522174 RepID=UPI003AEF233C
MKNSGSRTSSLGVYGITVAAELVGVGEQTLRLYERKGLLEPSRTAGGTRRYSEDDLQIVRRVIELLEAGVNLVGIRHVLELETENRLLRAELDRLSS